MKRMCVMLLTVVILSSGMVGAHRVHGSYRISEVTVRSWFGGGKPIINGSVEVYAIRDGVEELYVEGFTDEYGEYRFTPKIGVPAYKVDVESTRLPGHRTEILVNMSAAPELGGEELPTYKGVIAGFGYLAGLCGLAMMHLARKKKNA